MEERPERNPETAYRAIGDEGGLVVLPGRSEVKVLNPAGATIYALLDGKHTIDEIVVSILAEFDVTPVQAKSDVVQFIADLAAEGLLAGQTASTEHVE